MNSLARQGTLRDVQIISPLSKQISVEWEKTASGEGDGGHEISNCHESARKKSVALIFLFLGGGWSGFGSLWSIFIVFIYVCGELESVCMRVQVSVEARGV